MPNDDAIALSLETRKGGGAETRVVESRGAAALDTGEVLLRVESFALTTNNISYTAFGDTELRYWDFFPTGDPGWGHMPVWGIAVVTASTLAGLEAGERFHGYYPIATAVRMRPERITPRGFIDGTPHRKALASTYNHYTRCNADPGFAGGRADYQMLLRPLFITSLVLADFLQEHEFFGATRLVVSSASSKTAFGTGFCLRDRPDIELVALTSARNRAFVEGLGCYRQTLAYEDLESLHPDAPTVYVDFSGDEALRARIHAHFGARLRYDCSAGWAQTPQLAGTLPLPGPEPVFFFAADQIRKRSAEWGPQAFGERFGGALLAFIEQVANPGRPWMTVVESRGFEAARRTIAELHAGRSDPRAAHVVRLIETSTHGG